MSDTRVVTLHPGGLQVFHDTEIAWLPAVGSGVAVVACDPAAHIAAIAHVLLPEAHSEEALTKPGRFADTAIPALLDAMEHQGASRSKVQVRLVGAARLLKFREGEIGLDLGRRVLEALRQQLARHKIPVTNVQSGGSRNRSVAFAPASDALMVKVGHEHKKAIALPMAA